jgi:RNA polymerase sigma-70 factor (ECF subfamily)
MRFFTAALNVRLRGDGYWTRGRWQATIVSMKTEHAEDACPIDEAALVTAAQHDRAAFEPLYEQYVDPIYRYVFRQVDDHAVAEDLTTRTFQQALTTLPDFAQGGASFGGWLAGIAHDLIAQRRAGQEATDEKGTNDLPSPAAIDPALLAEQHDDAGDLLMALRQLPLDQQRAVVLKFGRARTSRAIGEELDLSDDEAMQLIHRALIALRAALESK